jgi:hypothetical protein
VKSIEPLSYTDDIYQQSSDNKVTYLLVTKEGATMSASFSTLNFSFTYDKNVLRLYQEAIDYLI